MDASIYVDFIYAKIQKGKFGLFNNDVRTIAFPYEKKLNSHTIHKNKLWVD